MSDQPPSELPDPSAKAGNVDGKAGEPCDDVTAQGASGRAATDALPGAGRRTKASKLARKAAPANEPRLKEFMIRRGKAGETKDARPTPFSANAEMEALANQIASRYNLRRVTKGKGKGWTAIILHALRRDADESSFLAALERRHAAEEKAWAEQYDALAARYQALAARLNNSTGGEPAGVET